MRYFCSQSALIRHSQLSRKLLGYLLQFREFFARLAYKELPILVHSLTPETQVRNNLEISSYFCAPKQHHTDMRRRKVSFGKGRIRAIVRG